MPLFTPDEIHALNDARSVLAAAIKRCGDNRRAAPENYSEADGYDYGLVSATAEAAERAVFMVLNYTSSHNVQKLTDEQIHNKEVDRRRSLGDAEGVSIDSDERGFELHFETGTGAYMLNIHGVGLDLLHAVDKQLRPYWQEAKDARRTHVPPVLTEAEIMDAYPPDDPKRYAMLAALKLAEGHERGFESGYSAAIHDAGVEGSRARAEIQEKVNRPW